MLLDQVRFGVWMLWYVDMGASSTSGWLACFHEFISAVLTLKVNVSNRFCFLILLHLLTDITTSSGW